MTYELVMWNKDAYKLFKKTARIHIKLDICIVIQLKDTNVHIDERILTRENFVVTLLLFPSGSHRGVFQWRLCSQM